MPDPGTGMHMGFSMEQRLELRQEMRLEQVLTMAQVQTMDTAGTGDARRQAQILRRLIRQIDASRYADPQEFVGRCLARLRRSTDDARQVLASLVEAVRALDPTGMEAVKHLLGYGILAFEKRSWVPAVEYDELARVFGARRDPATKAALFDFLGEDLLERRERSNWAHLIADLALEARLDDPTFLSAAKRLDAVPRQVLDRLEGELPDSLPRSIVTASRCAIAIDTLVAFYELMPSFYSDTIRAMVSRFVDTPAAEALVTRYAGVPLPLLAGASIFDPSAEQLEKLDSFSRDPRLEKDRDRRRHLYIGAHQLTLSASGKGMFDHILSVSTNAWEFEKLYQAVGNALRMTAGRKDVHYYPFDGRTFGDVYAKLRDRRIAGSVGAIPLSPGYTSKLAERLDDMPAKLPLILSRLGEIYKDGYPEGLPILAGLVEKLLDGEFPKWRYSHERAQAQLLQAARSKNWRENIHRTCILRPGDSVNQKTQALKLLGLEASDLYGKEFGTRPTREHVQALEHQIYEIEALLRERGNDKKDLGSKASELRTRYSLAKAVELLDGRLESLELARSFFSEKARDRRFVLYHDVIARALQCLEAPELRDLETVHIEETDDPVSLLNVGVDPVATCQRWTDPTGTNRCLLAYVLDANKKVWYTRDRERNTIARTVVRILPFRDQGILLLLEPTYSKHWSEDHGRALVSTALQKAARMSQEIRRPVRVGYTERRSEGQYRGVFKRYAQEAKVPVRRTKVDVTLPESMNLYEYSDALGGSLKSGSRVVGLELHYLVVGKG